MGIYEKAGLKKLALGIVEWITWVRIYGFKKGAGIYTSLRRSPNGVFTVRKLFSSPLILRDNYSDKAIFKQVFLEKQYEFQFFIPIEKATTILDGGANVGMASLYFSNLYPEAQIVAIEPEPNNFAMLQKNTAACPAVTCIQAGIWRSEEPIFIGNPDAMAASFSVQSGAGAEEGQYLRGVTIDGIMREKGWEKIDILKMDIEGAEKDIFNTDATRWLGKTRLLIIELHDSYRPGCTKTVFKALENYDYTAFFHHENIFIYFNAGER